MYTKLQKEGFTTADPNLDNTALGLGGLASEERGGFIDQSRSASDNLCGSLGERAYYPLSWR